MEFKGMSFVCTTNTNFPMSICLLYVHFSFVFVFFFVFFFFGAFFFFGWPFFGPLL